MAYPMLWGLVAALVIAVPAWRLRALDRSGLVAGVIVCTVIFGAGGLQASVALVAFFLSGSILSGLPLRKDEGGRMKDEGDSNSSLILHPSSLRKGRNWKQVAANGGLPLLAILAASLIPGTRTAAMHFFFGAVAAAAADSWATEIGTRYDSNVRDILTARPMQAGMSGGVSVIGILASLAGAVFIALSPLPFGGIHTPVLIAIVAGGFLGSLLDSVLGSSVQAVYWCEECTCMVESPMQCNQAGSGGIRPAILIKGNRIITNNVVNFVSSGISGLFVMLLLDFAK